MKFDCVQKILCTPLLSRFSMFEFRFWPIFSMFISPSKLFFSTPTHRMDEQTGCRNQPATNISFHLKLLRKQPEKRNYQERYSPYGHYNLLCHRFITEDQLFEDIMLKRNIPGFTVIRLPADSITSALWAKRGERSILWSTRGAQREVKEAREARGRENLELREKCDVGLAWLIKRNLCRLVIGC